MRSTDLTYTPEVSIFIVSQIVNKKNNWLGSEIKQRLIILVCKLPKERDELTIWTLAELYGLIWVSLIPAGKHNLELYVVSYEYFQL